MAGLVVMSSLSLKPITPCQERVAGSIQGLPSLARSSTSHRVSANQIKNIKIYTLYMDGFISNFIIGKGGYHYSGKYGGNIDGYRFPELDLFLNIIWSGKMKEYIPPFILEGHFILTYVANMISHLIRDS
ncbi:hypothetical protein MKW92_042562 [Papaver armeniacum]|nr:hypothetical protein MKW92_042562 [Papaver armeniacum]